MAAIEDILGVSEVVKNDGSVVKVKDLCAGKLVDRGASSGGLNFEGGRQSRFET